MRDAKGRFVKAMKTPFVILLLAAVAMGQAGTTPTVAEQLRGLTDPPEPEVRRTGATMRLRTGDSAFRPTMSDPRA